MALKRQRYTIKTVSGSEEVTGMVYGEYGYHKSIAGYAVTQLSSGRRAWTAKTANEARQICLVLEGKPVKSTRDVLTIINEVNEKF